MKIQCLSFFILFCILLTGCTEKDTGVFLFAAAEGSEEYAAIMNTYLSGYEIELHKDEFYAEVAKGNVAACFDVQAIPALDQGVAQYWYPHISATVVIAVDRTRTDAAITGWRSLWESQVPVGVGSTSVIRNMLVIGALSYGLNPNAPAKQDVFEFLEHLCQNGGFELDKPDVPVLLCLDYEAASWNQNGGNYEIIVPEEGTISYSMGLLSDSPLTLDPGLDEALLSSGFPLVNGEKPREFPDNYQSAHRMEDDDYGWFLEITGDSSRDLRRKVFHTRLYTTADLREHILSALLIAAAILMWRGTVSHRLLRRDVRWIVGLMCWAMVGWLLLRLLKYQLVTEGFLCRMCWYGYYIFQLVLPVLLLYLTEIMDRAEGEKKLLRPLWPPVICYVCSVLLVMTNDLHQLVFCFDPDGNWNRDYRYGPGYWIIIAILFVFLLLAIGKLFYKGRRSTYWQGKIFPLLFCLGLFAYIIAYIYRVPLAWESDMTVCICMISILFFETVLHAGMIPVNIQYKTLFASAPIGLTLLDESGRTVLSAYGTFPVSHSVWMRMNMDMKQPLLRNSDTLLHAIPIRNGIAVWQEDISQLNRLRNEIQNVQFRLEAANTLLREEGEIKRRLLRAETKRALFEQLDCDMERRITSLVRLIEKHPETEEPRRMTAYITLCLCHIKRRCNLFFLTRQGKVFHGDELDMYLQELAELACYGGIQMVVRCEQKSVLEICKAALCYDFAFETILCMWKVAPSTLIGYVEAEDSNLVFRFLPGSNPGHCYYSEEVMTAISDLGGKIIYKDLDDTIGICMMLHLGR